MISKNAIKILESRYFKKDENGNLIENAEGLFTRVASAVASADDAYEGGNSKETTKEFYNLMTSLDFLPNSPTLMNAGRDLGQLSACFVLPIEDSMEQIFETIKNAALIHKSGGGTGFSFSRLRSKGASVNSTGGVASGPISFMKVFNAATEAVKQGGTRRGANMGILRIDHPDIMEFINCKTNTSEITNFNISVGITEAFMKSVIADEDYSLIEPSTNKEVGKLNAKDVFNVIVNCAHQTGEPGIIFLDRLNRDNIVPMQGEIESTNPCGEQPLLPYESCNLGSINLANHIKKGKNGYEIDRGKIVATVKSAVHFLDNVIDVNKYPLDKIGEVTKQTRKIGLGVMGFSDMLLYLGVPYNSDEGVAIGKQVMKLINDTAHSASIELAKTRGAFPLFEESIYAKKAPIRNGTLTTIAPTGTLSIIAGVSSGVEPIFAYAYIRNVMDGTHLIETNNILKEKLVERGIYSDELMKQIIEQGSLAHVDGIPEDIKNVFVCAHDVEPIWHTKMQAAFQEHTDNAVSKTVNFSNCATVQDVYEAYMLSYTLGCKGVTIYRDGSRSGQVLNIGKVNDGKESNVKANDEKEAVETAQPACCACEDSIIVPRPRPDITTGLTEKVKIGCGNLYITVNYDETGICEVFTNTGRAGGCPSQSEATARLVSIAMRSGISSDAIIEQLKGIRCPSTIRQRDMKVTSCPDAIAKMIEKVMKFKNGNNPLTQTKEIARAIGDNTEEVTKTSKYCPECGSKMEHEGGCVCCRQCGYSKCG